MSRNLQQEARYQLGYRSGLTGEMWGECFSDDPDYQEGFSHAQQEKAAMSLEDSHAHESARI